MAPGRRFKTYGNKISKFSQDLAPTTRRIWYRIATGNDFEKPRWDDGGESLPKIFATHFGHVAIIWTSWPPVPRRLAGNFQHGLKIR